MTTIEVESRCVGCEVPMTYVVETNGAGAPFVEPKESRAVSHAHGHLCASCAGHVKILLAQLRVDRAALRPKAVTTATAVDKKSPTTAVSELERRDRARREDRYPRVRSYEELPWRSKHASQDASQDDTTRYHSPGCGVSGTCDECRMRGVR
jgi:hypothetical protein